MKPASFVLRAGVFIGCLGGTVAVAAEPSSADVEFFESKVRPVLSSHCFSCHANGKTKGGLSLASRDTLLKGGDTGPAIVPAHPEQSLFIEALGHDRDVKMPPKGKLPQSTINDLTEWVRRGAPWPAAPAVASASSLRTYGDKIMPEERAFWSFQPIRGPAAPAVRDSAWSQKPLDRFILGKLEEKGLRPVGTASRRSLLRRAAFDLTGLPPRPEEVEAFVADPSPDAFARAVERLLASPHYGERWARHWLDVARYGEDQANDFRSRNYPYGYRYRDWVVKAFQDDMPYDRFLIEQIAGDLLSDGDKASRQAALGYFACGPHYYDNVMEEKENRANNYDEKIDTLCRGLLGLTVACARCHDHKYDPIPTRDYYSLAGVFKNTEYEEIPTAAPDVLARYREAQAKIKSQEDKVNRFVETETRRLTDRLVADTDRYMLAAFRLNNLRKTDPTTTAKSLADKESLIDIVVERWERYLFGRINDDRPHLSAWRTVMAGCEAQRDHSGDAVMVGKVTQAARSFKDELMAARRLREDLEKRHAEALAKASAADRATMKAPTLDRPKAEMMKDVLALDGLYGFKPEQAETLLGEKEKKALAGMKSELRKLNRSAPTIPVVHALTEAADAGDMPVYIRGNVHKEGEIVPRRFLRILAGDEPPRFGKGSGRLDLALAIASPANPLTARVIVNRVWQWHLGTPLVASPSNFGKTGEKPTHPELLDHLASFFIANGWSFKALHREIMLSATYQLASTDDEMNTAIDPANQLYWRGNVRRLDAESFRDAMLASSGRLDSRIGGAPTDLAKADNGRRTIYGAVSRHRLNNLLRLFDFPDPNITCESRMVTTVPLQQLFVLNSDFMAEQAKALAARLTALAPNDEGRVRQAFAILYGRPPNEEEVRLGCEFLADPDDSSDPKPKLSRWEQYAQVLLSANEFIYVD